MNIDYRDRNKPITAEDLIRRYNFENISKAMKATQSNKKDLDQTNTIMNEFILATTEELQDLQDQIDGNITTWFYSGVPTLSNEPASEWVTDEEKERHLGDLYYDQTTGYAYRFQLTNNVFNWYKLTDSDITEALAIANAAKDTADAKRRVFVTQPTPPYDVGDIWLKDDSDLYRCRTSRTEGSYNPSDWIIGTNYTDDSYAMSVEGVLNAFMDTVTNDYATKVLLETTADSINANVTANANEIHNITTTTGNVSGNPIEITDAINTNPISFELDGNTEQNGTPTPTSPIPVNNVTGRQEIDIVGKNLCDEIFESGNINDSGQETTSATTYRSINYYNVNGGQTLICSYNATTGTNLNWCACYDKNKTFLRRLTNLKTNPFTINDDTFYIRLGFYKSGSITRDDFSDVQLEYGNQATTYEPYNGNTYEINLGKNLFDKDNVNVFNGYIDSTNGKISTDNNMRCVYIPIKPNTDYTISKIVTPRFVVGLTSEIPANNVTCISYTRDDSATVLSLHGQSNAKYLIVFLTNSYSSSTWQNILDSIQIEEGNTATTYSEYFTPIELCKIGDYQDYLYKVNNKWYIHKEIGKVVLDGSEYWQTDTWFTSTDNSTHFKLMSFNNYSSDYKPVICDKFNYVDNRQQNNGNMFTNLPAKFLLFSMNTISTVDNFKTWLSNNNPVVYYVLATATDTEITNEKLIEQLDSILLLEGYNYIIDYDSLVQNMSMIYYRQTPLSSTYVNKTEMQSSLDITSSEIMATTSQNIENSYNQTQEDLNTNYYKKEVVDQLVLNSASGLTNTFSEAGGNNVLRNTNFSATEVLEANQLYEYWYGNVVKMNNNNSANGISILLQNDTLYQIQTAIANGNYTLSFYYKILNPLATCKVVINDIEYELTEEDYTLFQTGINDIEPLEINSNSIQLSFVSDIDNACEIYDIMLNIGTVKLAYSQNQNETTTSTVNISKGITISSSDKNVKLSATSDGIRIKNVNTNEVVTDFTETGMTTKNAVISDSATIVGIHRQIVGNQIWDSLV